MTGTNWERMIEASLANHAVSDAAHDIGHLRRVLAAALRIAEAEGPFDRETLVAAALLHDLVSLPKDHPERGRSSRLAGQAARELLTAMGFPAGKLAGVVHAIEAHSWSAGIEPMTPEARALQDADRLDALGAVGIARCMAVSAALGRALFDPDDPLARRRPLDEGRFGLDHFQTKLYRLPAGMRTAAGRALAQERADYMRTFAERIAEESAEPTPHGELHSGTG